MLDPRFPEPPMLTHPEPAKPLTEYEEYVNAAMAASADMAQLVDEFSLRGVLKMLTAYAQQQDVASRATEPLTATVWKLIGQRLDHLASDRFVSAVSKVGEPIA